ncbi:hypothetical protein ACFQV2_08050 [Actinokineospora soli]|uniref:Uncharacterized protein n=1 Tax=Actinokineospora soli TaxID=1048753 RepID=A0ABW2TIL5_9PSEU
MGVGAVEEGSGGELDGQFGADQRRRTAAATRAAPSAAGCPSRAPRCPSV